MTLLCLLLLALPPRTYTQESIGPGDSGAFTDPRDGHIYQWISIGSQVWMAENLAFLPVVHPPGHYSYEDFLCYVYGYSGTDTAAAKRHPNYSAFGVLYNWYAAMDGEPSSDKIPSGVRGVCPDGWHLPGNREWDLLKEYLGNNSHQIGKLLASDIGWAQDTAAGTVGNKQHLNDKTGFNAKPGGFYGTRDSFWNAGYETVFWTSTELGKSAAFHNSLEFNSAFLHESSTSKALGYYVRCIRDD